MDCWVGRAAARRLYFTEIKLGTPPKRYYVQVDTGSDILWVNCISCDRCPRKSGLGVLTIPHSHLGSQLQMYRLDSM